MIDVSGGCVERPAPGAAPTAFRIWKAGDNPTDHGQTKFTEKSAIAIAADQVVRRNLFSIDVDHLSLSPIAPPESRKAVGWHRLEVRRDANGGAELWATEVEWTDVARSGLEKSPPEWRYMSPAFDVDKRTREVIAYLNTALTNNPATYDVTALATRIAASRAGAKPMTEHQRAIATRMGNPTDEPAVRREGRRMIFGVMSIEEAVRATRAASGGVAGPMTEQQRMIATRMGNPTDVWPVHSEGCRRVYGILSVEQARRGPR